MMKRVVPVVFVGVLMSAGGASAHVTGWDSVNADETLYYSNPSNIFPKAIAHAVKEWNEEDALIGGQGVYVAPADAAHPATLEIVHQPDCGGGWFAYVVDQPEGQADRMGVNSCALRKRTKRVRLHNFTHEFGHALGLAHPSNQKAHCGHSVMVTHKACAPKLRISPGAHDRKDYRALWDGVP